MVIKLSGAFCIYYLLLKYGPLPFGVGFETGLIGNFGGGEFLYGPLPPPPTEGDPLYGALLLIYLSAMHTSPPVSLFYSAILPADRWRQEQKTRALTLSASLTGWPCGT